MPAPKIALELIGRFDRNLEAYRSGHYNEAQMRAEFIDPLFEALGWDIYNKEGIAEAYKDVVHEDAVKVGGATKAPDYSFRIGGTRKFFLEAKKPSIDIKGDPHPAFQLRRYAWSAKLPLSILTDFEEFAVYDCRIRPLQTDKPSTARVLYLTYTEYADRWDELYGLFSKNAVLKGEFDRYVASTTRKRGTAEVDDAFLREIEDWREALARNIALRNTDLSQRQVNFAVGRTIDRIIFLRICEDRGTEEPNRLMALQNGTNIYRRLIDLYHRADEKYNSGLFHFRKERDRPLPPDELTLKLTIDDKVLKDIFKGLYYPDSPYEFSVLPADILGQVYEQFLGKVIRLTPAHHAKVEDKPEVKKAGGIYYTPTYIVDYIVKHTVGKLLEGKTPRQAAKLRILDPACGSGSFLLGAYQLLLDWHRDWYVEQLNRTGTAHRALTDSQIGRVGATRRVAHTKEFPIYQAGEKEYRLTTAERKRILLNNIYGVDIDPQAVEVTKLSLLLKVLEEESAETINRQLKLLHERALPDLGSNIKCGNSLIGPDFYEGQQMNLLDEEECLRINVFYWEAEFPEIFNRKDAKNYGFDAVIGNPPYRRELDYKHLMDEIASTHFGRKYRAPRMDLWYYFVHRGLEILKSSSILSFITNAYWTAGTGAEKLIVALQDTAHIDEIFFFNKLKIFHKASGQHMIIRITNAKINQPTRIKIVDPSSETNAEPFVTGKAPVMVFDKTPEQLFCNNKVDIQPPSDELLSKLNCWTLLGALGKVRQGIAENPASINRKTNEKYGNQWEVGQGVFGLRPEEVEYLNMPDVEKELLRPYYDLCDVGRYFIASNPSLILIYSTRKNCPDIDAYPTIRQHLSQFRVIMEGRRETRKGSNSWWHLHWPRDESLWQSPKILSVQMAARPAFVPSHQPVYVPFSINVFVPYDTTNEHLTYITSLLNSRLMWKWFQHNAKRRGVGLEINGNVLARTPIRTIDFSDPADKARHDRLVQLVERMLALHKELAQARTEHEKTALQRQIDATDGQIDTLVYELYGLTEGEIVIVEGN